MEPVVGTPPENASMTREPWNQTNPPENARGADIGELRAQLERLRQREAQIMTLIGCKNPDKLMHDLRNVLNELQLLRMLADTDKS
jgi:hypothetical protein